MRHRPIVGEVVSSIQDTVVASPGALADGVSYYPPTMHIFSSAMSSGESCELGEFAILTTSARGESERAIE